MSRQIETVLIGDTVTGYYQAGGINDMSRRRYKAGAGKLMPRGSSTNIVKCKMFVDLQKQKKQTVSAGRV